MKARALCVSTFLFALACGPGGLSLSLGLSVGEEDTDDSTEVTTTPEPDLPPDPPDPSTTDMSEATTHDFVPPSDPPPLNECDPWQQDCPEGEKCAPYASTGGVWDANKCVPILGNQGVGEPCHSDGIVEATDDCDATSFCFRVDEDGMGSCHAFCTGTPDDPMCPPGSECALASDGVLIPCIPTCDPLEQDCFEGTACYWIGYDFSCVFTAGDGIPLGQPCAYINDCEAGLMCVDAAALTTCEGPSCCTTFCNLELGDEPCAELPGTACVSLFPPGEAPPSYEHIGVCVVP